ncbi:MAG: hypothetical protein WAZ18_02280 [Alphaproteobacteria bacterium]
MAHSLEATAHVNPSQAVNEGLSMKVDALHTATMAVVNSILHCNNIGKMYVSDPSVPGKDVNGCVDIDGGLPNPATECDIGSVAIADGTDWTCTQTLAVPNTLCGGLRCESGAQSGVGTLNKVCQSLGKNKYYSTPAGGTGSSGCDGCSWGTWTGSAWTSFNHCNGCKPLLQVTCY